LLRRLKLVTRRLTEEDASVQIYYFKNTNRNTGLSVDWEDALTTITNSGTAGITFTDVTATMTDSGEAGVSWYSPPAILLDMAADVGNARLVKTTKALNETGWSHAFSFVFTSSETAKYEPVMWGYEWLFVRRDHG
jgi:hypothetical protein